MNVTENEYPGANLEQLEPRIKSNRDLALDLAQDFPQCDFILSAVIHITHILLHALNKGGFHSILLAVTQGRYSTSFPEAAILLVSDGDRDLWPLASGQVQLRKSAIHGLPVTLCMLRVKSDKSDWFWSQSIVFKKAFKTRMSLDLARGPDFQRMTKGEEVGCY